MEKILRADKIILVTGATGQQGGAVAAQLVSAGWRVRALVRNSSKPASRALAWKGIELATGDLNDGQSLSRALNRVYGVFCVLTGREGGVDSEIRQGKNIAEAALAADVEHFIYSSVGGADRNTGIPHFERKWLIEEYMRRLGLPVTIFRPVFMMNNFNSQSMHTAILNGLIRMAIRPDRALQMLATEDLAYFVSSAFENPSTYLGQAIELAGDELTMPQLADIFSKILRRPVRFEEQPIDEVRSINSELAVMMEWFNNQGYRDDIRALRMLHPGLLTFEMWLLKTGGLVRAA